LAAGGETRAPCISRPTPVFSPGQRISSAQEPLSQKRPEAGEGPGGWRGSCRAYAYHHTWRGSHGVGVP
uniref:Uncharacterized protein n=1 Tax=Schistocephalus solidus TaxID=70667 RepID=A0A183TPN4_SCHSO